jgi:hypothetical protein
VQPIHRRATFEIDVKRRLVVSVVSME